jgi:hypothetical protein
MDDEFQKLVNGEAEIIKPEIDKLTLESLDERIGAVEELLAKIGSLIKKPAIVPREYKKRRLN